MVFTFAIIFVCSLTTSPRNHIANIHKLFKNQNPPIFLSKAELFIQDSK